MNSSRPDFQKRRAVVWSLICICALTLALKAGLLESVAGVDGAPRPVHAAGRADRDHDGDIDYDDLELFSLKVLGLGADQVDWCQWITDAKSKKQLGGLYDFVVDYFQCGSAPSASPLAVVHSNDHPTRLAIGPNGKIYVTDPKLGSVFIYPDPNGPTAELKSLGKPLGIAVDDAGMIYVGNDKNNSIDVYDSRGSRVTTIGRGLLKMPNDLAFDWDGNLYVADSANNVVWKFGPNGGVVRSIGDGRLDFPAAVEIAYYDDGAGGQIGELYVADRKHHLVQVFDLNGGFQRSFGGMPEPGGMMGWTWEWEGKFVKIQSLAIDALGRLHALDCYMNNIQILDPVTGDYIDSYGIFGTEPGELKLPLDIAIDAYGNVIVANTDNGRIEIIYTVP